MDNRLEEEKPMMAKECSETEEERKRRQQGIGKGLEQE